MIVEQCYVVQRLHSEEFLVLSSCLCYCMVTVFVVRSFHRNKVRLCKSFVLFERCSIAVLIILVLQCI